MAGEELLALVFEEVHRRPLTLLVWPTDCRTLMALPKKVNWVTFDVYGTLIDWETGIYDAFKAEASRDGFTIDRDELIPMFHEISQDIESGSYELYAEVLRRTAVQIAKRLGVAAGALARRASCPTRSRAGSRSRRPTPSSRRSPRSSRPGSSRTSTTSCSARRAGTSHRLRPRRHRPAGALLQARPGALQGVPAPDRRQEGLGPHRVEPVPRRRAARQLKVPVIWVNRNGEDLEPGGRRPTPRSPRCPRPRSCSAL